MYRTDEEGKIICPFCDTHFTPVLTRPEGDCRPIQQIYPDAPRWQREQLIMGVCTDKCWRENLGMEPEGGSKYVLTEVHADGTTTVLKEAYSLLSLAHTDIDPGFFPITFVSREDVIEALRREQGDESDEDESDEDNTDIHDRVNAMTDSDMTELASDMADDYVEQLYWSQIPILVERYVHQPTEEIPASEEPA